MVNSSSAFRTSASDSCSFIVVVVLLLLFFSSTVVPLSPVVRELWLGRVAAEKEGDEASDDGLVVALCEELGNSFEGHDPPDGLHNKPEIRQRRRTFHIV